jgi:hypothetical protein
MNLHHLMRRPPDPHPLTAQEDAGALHPFPRAAVLVYAFIYCLFVALSLYGSNGIGVSVIGG